MRPRYSIKTLLVLTTVIALTLGGALAAFQYPGRVRRQFGAAVMKGDVAQANAMIREGRLPDNASECRVLLAPVTPSYYFSLTRKIDVIYRYNEKTWLASCDVGLNGVTILSQKSD